jgi:hypothetical protein
MRRSRDLMKVSRTQDVDQHGVGDIARRIMPSVSPAKPIQSRASVEGSGTSCRVVVTVPRPDKFISGTL